MKLSTFILAFIVSTAIHVGALTSDLLHVNAQSVPDSKARTVKLHIIPAAAPKAANPLPEVFEEKIENPRTVDPEIHNTDKAEPLENRHQDMPEVNTSEIALSEKHPVAEKPSPVKPPVYRGKPAIPEPLPREKTHSFEQFEEAWIKTSRPVVPTVSGPGEGACEDCSGSLIVASSRVPARVEMGGREIGPTSPATITLSCKPTYPRYSRLHKEEGTTVLTVEILADGKLGNVEVIQSSGHRRLDRAAVEGMQKAELIPALKDGRKVASVKRISIRFDLEDWGE
jgi:protein TonB